MAESGPVSLSPQMSSRAADELSRPSTAAILTASKRWQIKDLVALWFKAMVGTLRLLTEKVPDRVTSVRILLTQKGNGRLNFKWHALSQTHNAREAHNRRTSTSGQRSEPESCGSSIPKPYTLIWVCFAHRRITADANERAK
jgi:hypothetical protein